MGKMKQLFMQKQDEIKALGGLYDSHNQLTTSLEMSFPYFREMIHQATDSNELDKVVDMLFALEADRMEV